MESKQKDCTSTYPDELPACEGPKLQCFQHYASPIKWLRRLDEDSPDSSKESTQAYIFEVEIETKLYALNVFKFYDVEEYRYYWDSFVSEDFESEAIRTRQITLHLDRFYAECRAYGRIKIAIEQGEVPDDIVIPCLGFVLLGNCYRTVLEDYNVDLEEYCLDNDFSSVSSRQSEAPESTLTRAIRCIVKELRSRDHGITHETINAIHKDLRKLNGLKVYNLDVRKDNFCDGKLVSFASSRTEPHCLITPDNEFLSRESRHGDLAMLGDVVNELGLFVS